MDDIIQGAPRVNRGVGNFTLKGRAEVEEQRDHDSQRIEDSILRTTKSRKNIFRNSIARGF